MLSHKSITGKLEVREINDSLTSYHIDIHGAFPLSAKDNKVFKIARTFEQAALKSLNKQIIISCVNEPMLFTSRDHIEKNSNGLSWFEFLHGLSKKFNFPEENIIFLTSNVYSTESYNKWCTINNIVNKIQVHDQPKNLWLHRLILNGCSYVKKEETNHMSMFLGRPTLHRNIVLQWYLQNVVGTSRLENMLARFFYKDFSIPNEWHLTTEQHKYFTQLTEIDKKNNSVPKRWLGDTEDFKSDFASCLFNFNIDYHEAENFNSYTRYTEFKSANDWWKEDVLSEKLFRSVIYKKPFIRLGMPNSLKVLRSWGFKTFDGVLFDESYDDIEDCFERSNHILSQVTAYLDMSFDDVKKKIYSSDVQDILEYNYNVAYEIYNKKEGIDYV